MKYMRGLTISVGLMFALLAAASNAQAPMPETAPYECALSKLEPSTSEAFFVGILTKKSAQEIGPDVTGEIDRVVTACRTQLQYPREHNRTFVSLILSALLRDHAKERFAALDFDVRWLDEYLDEKLRQPPQSSANFTEQHSAWIRTETLDHVAALDTTAPLKAALIETYTAARVNYAIAVEQNKNR